MSTGERIFKKEMETKGLDGKRNKTHINSNLKLNYELLYETIQF